MAFKYLEYTYNKYDLIVPLGHVLDLSYAILNELLKPEEIILEDILIDTPDKPSEMNLAEKINLINNKVMDDPILLKKN